ncbi:MAG: hypothetical protein SPL43_09435 [Prevotella sp.]|nr:hypothetical protein [Prevotella sp.]
MYNEQQTAEELAGELRSLVQQLQMRGRNDLLLRAIGVPLLEELRIEAARGTLKPLIITEDYKFYIGDEGREVVLSPIHKSLYLLFLKHPDGIEFKNLSDYRDELMQTYLKVSHRLDVGKMEETIDRLTNPTDNAINEKCSRIKAAFYELMDEYSASYYIISSHVTRFVEGSSHIWYKRLKCITLPRELVIYR